MPRAVQTLSLGLVALAAYTILLLPALTDPNSLPANILNSIGIDSADRLKTANFPSVLPLTLQNEVIPLLPVWGVVTFGAYLLGRLGLGVMRFQDCDEAYEELKGQIEKAKKDLDKRGVGWT